MKISPNPWGTTNPRVDLDISQVVSIDGHWGDVRTAGQIASLAASRKGADGAQTRNVRFWKSGAWTLAPIQQRFSEAQERAAVNIDLAQFQTDGATTPTALVQIRSIQMVQTKIFRDPAGIGFVHQADTKYTGDVMYRKSVDGLSTNWDSQLADLPPPPQRSTGTAIAGIMEWNGERVPMDCVWHSKYPQKANQGYFLRWLCPGTKLNTPDSILNFYFGEYCLIIGGSGEATLAEYARPADGGAYRWRKRDTFRYCIQGRAIGEHHTMTIFPHVGLHNEKYIIFASNEMDATTGGAAGVLGAGSSQSVINDEFLFVANDITRDSDLDETGGAATREGIVRMDIRRDLRVLWHVSQLIFENSGGIIDGLWSLPDGHVSTTEHPIQQRLLAIYPEGADGSRASIDLTVKDGRTFSTTEIKYPGATFIFNGTDPGDQGFSFATPILWGYELYRPVTNNVVSPGKFSIPVASTTILSATSGDPRQERGEVRLHDLNGDFPRLRNRGSFWGRIVVDYKPETGDPIADAAVEPVPVVLTAGEVIRPEVIQMGVPSGSRPDWQDASLIFSGMGNRLANTSVRTISVKHFGVDDLAPPENLDTGYKPAWKVTDIIGYVLMNRGFQESQVLIGSRDISGKGVRDSFTGVFESSIRLWSGAADFQNDEKLTTYTDALGYCMALCRNYLGAYLIYDQNAGPLTSSISEDETDNVPLGAWRIVRPLEGTDPVWNFVSGRQIESTSSGLAHSNYPAAYMPNTAPYRAQGTIYAIRPDHNRVWVFTGPSQSEPGKYKFEAHLKNYKSYKVPGSIVDPDPDSPHYRGEEILAIIADPSLYVPNDLALTQKAVDFTCRRIFDFACRGRRGFRFKAPLVTIIDADTGRRRPLRFGDVVTLDGQADWFVKSVSISIQNPLHEADYEIERYEPL